MQGFARLTRMTQGLDVSLLMGNLSPKFYTLKGVLLHVFDLKSQSEGGFRLN